MSSQYNPRFQNQGLLIILGALIIAIFASIIFLSQTLNRVDNTIKQSGLGSRNAQLMQDLLVGLIDAETGQRGYVITGDEAFLEPYENAQEDLPQTLKAIKADKTGTIKSEDYKELEKLVKERLGIIKEVIELKKAGNDQAAADIIRAGTGKVVMDQLREKIRVLAGLNLQAIRHKQDQAHNSVELATTVAVAVLLFVLAICFALIWYFQHSILKERSLEHTKSEFLSLASHQLRTPATNVKQYVGLLLDGYLGKLTKKQLGALEIAYKNNEFEIKIMNDLLDVAKLDLQRIQLHKQRVNVVSLVRQTMKDFQPVAEARRQSISLRAPKELQAVVDRTYFKGVVEKLIDNAIKYSRDKTRITLRLRKVSMLSGDMFELTVKDQGLGIHKREVPKLFMKFSRLTNEFSANSIGSGLGLYWVKQVVALHDGTISVSSKEGRGSEFVIQLPIA
jgi:signal transduction histidine kinase